MKNANRFDWSLWGPNAAPNPSALPSRTRVLCICDEPAVAQRELGPLFSKAGLEMDVIPAGGGDPCTHVTAEYQCVLFDVARPSGDAMDACARLRGCTQLPILLILRGAARGDVLQGFQAGADAYVLAPFDGRELLARLTGLCRRQSGRTGVA
jgi:DNA-binding response OmpR family regulator